MLLFCIHKYDHILKKYLFNYLQIFYKIKTLEHLKSTKINHLIHILSSWFT